MVSKLHIHRSQWILNYSAGDFDVCVQCSCSGEVPMYHCLLNPRVNISIVVSAVIWREEMSCFLTLVHFLVSL